MNFDMICMNELRNFYSLPPLTEEVEKDKPSVVRYKKFMSECQKTVKPDLRLLMTANIMPAFFKAAASAEDLSTGDELYRELIDEFMQGYKTSWRPTLLADLVTIVFEKPLFLSIPNKTPSLELGMGEGYTSNYIFKNTKITVGSDALLQNVVNTFKYNKHHYFQGIDMSKIPYQDETFETIYNVHAIDHLDSRAPTLHEMARVLRPGGYLAFSDIGEHYSKNLPMPDVLKAIGFDELSEDYKDWLLDFGGLNHESVTTEWYQEILEELGFEEIKITPFMSTRLARLCYFHFELRNIFQADPFAVFKSDGNEAYYLFFRQFIDSTILPLMEMDKDNIAKEKKWTNIFISAKKKGTSQSLSVPEEKILDNIVCPCCKVGMNLGGGGQNPQYYYCSSCQKHFPVIALNVDDGRKVKFPLLAEAYAEAFAQVVKEVPLSL